MSWRYNYNAEQGPHETPRRKGYPARFDDARHGARALRHGYYWQETKDFATRAQKLLKSLSSIPSNPQAVYWIPGNHDPLSFFPESNLENHVDIPGVNVHGRVVELAPQLLLGGFGGCSEAIEDGKEVWGAYPYRNKQMEDKLKPLEKAIEDSVKSENSMLLMTHSGPHLSSTTHVTGVDPNRLTMPGCRSHVINRFRGIRLGIHDC